MRARRTAEGGGDEPGSTADEQVERSNTRGPTPRGVHPWGSWPLSIEALEARAARLFKIDLEPPQQVIGKNTAAALRSGVIYGFAGQVDAIVRRVREEATALATGAEAEP